MSLAGQDHIRQRIARYVDTENADPYQTARDITSSISECTNLQQVEDLCYSVASATLEVLLDEPDRIDSPERQEVVSHQLVLLCKALKELPAPLDQDSKPYTTWAGQPWRDLPMLGAEMRERWNSAPRRDALPGECCSENAWVALNLFAAKLTSQGVLHLALYAIWQMREALEGDTPWCPPGPDTIMVPVAAVWVRIAGHALIRREDDFGRAAQGGQLWKGKSGFCLGRWMLWKTRFEHLAADHPERPDWKQMCLDAADRIAILIDATLGEEG